MLLVGVLSACAVSPAAPDTSGTDSGRAPTADVRDTAPVADDLSSQPGSAEAGPPGDPSPARLAIGQAMIVRTTENVPDDGWLWLLDRAYEAGIARIDLLVKQDEPRFESDATGRTLDSGELLVALPGERTAQGWADSGWLEDFIDKAHELDMEVWAWWPAFQDAQMAARWPADAYAMPDGHVFVDLAVPEVQGRQAELLEKLLETYDFDGVSLDWLRYGAWEHGERGPAARQFETAFDRPWGQDILDNEYQKARWYELRARALERWLAELIGQWRRRDATVRWGAYVLPWQFAESSQDYRRLGQTGLDYLQPMAYWGDWGFPPKWTGEVLLPRARLAAPTTATWPALDLESPDGELNDALASMRPDRLAGISWFVYGAWGDEHFDRIARLTFPDRLRDDSSEPSIAAAPAPAGNGGTAGTAITARTAGVGAQLAVASATGQPTRDEGSPRTEAASPTAATTGPLAPKDFDEAAGVWNIVGLAELYRRGALADSGPMPVVPVLAMHGFAEGPLGSGATAWTTSTAYLDALLDLLKSAGFRAMAFSQLQAYLIAGDPLLLPPRPLVVSIDDASASVASDFYPRARRLDLPFLTSVVTSWPMHAGEAESPDALQGHGGPTLTWAALRDLYDGGLLEVASHSHDLHRYSATAADGSAAEPALVAREFDPARGRLETSAEHARRTYADLGESRVRLQDELGTAPTVLNWPYGVHDAAAVQSARSAGFTHFLLYGGNRFATYGADAEFVPRLSVTRIDESLPLVFPSDAGEAQRWWLAFLRTAWWTRSPFLLEATLAQLDPIAAEHPRAEIARAAVEWLWGENGAAAGRLERLRQRFPGDAAVAADIDELTGLYQGLDG